MVQCGGAGHSIEIAKRLSSKGRLIGIDRDEKALNAAKSRLKQFDNVIFIHDNHDNIKNILKDLNIEKNKTVTILIAVILVASLLFNILNFITLMKQ